MIVKTHQLHAHEYNQIIYNQIQGSVSLQIMWKSFPDYLCDSQPCLIFESLKEEVLYFPIPCDRL